MTNLMQDSAAWLGERLNESAGRTVTLSRRSGVTVTTSDPFVGVVSRHDYEDFDPQGLPLLVEGWDWLLTTSQVVLAGSVTRPKAGDLLAETLNGATVTYEVCPIARRPCVENRDSSGVRLLVRSKKV